jgi:hypothetical protein
MKKHLLTFLLLCLVTSAGFGQWYKSVLPSPAFTRALDSIVLDFRFDYRNIQGGIVDSLGQTETYASMVKLPGTADCRILRFHSPEDTTACWQAIVYSGDSYKEAARAYENTVRLVKKSNISWIDRSTVKFAGEMVPAREDLRFTTTILLLTLEDTRYQDFRAEIELISTKLDTWEVQLNLSKKIEVPATLGFEQKCVRATGPLWVL